MALTVVAITPEDSQNDVAIDSQITVEFDGPIDPFTVAKGISLYCDTDNLWSGPDLAMLDTKYRDVLQIGTDYSFYPVNYTIVGNTVTIKPQVSLIPDKAHYVSVLPGNDATRYISAPTTGIPVYLKQDPLQDGSIEILSAFTGKANGTYTITFTSLTKVDVVFEGDYLGEFIFASGEEVNIGDLKISISGTWTINDVATIACTKASGVGVIYKNKFVTSKYMITAPTSIRIEDKLKLQAAAHSLKIVGTMPHGLSVNNSKCNPIVIKFSQPIDLTQDFLSYIRISKTSLVTGAMKAISFYAKPAGDTVKLYLAAVDNNAPIDEALELDEIILPDIKAKLTILE